MAELTSCLIQMIKVRHKVGIKSVWFIRNKVSNLNPILRIK